MFDEKSRKGGNVVAVLQMVNKKDDEDFNEQASIVGSVSGT